MDRYTYIKTIAILSILLLSSLVGCDRCSNPNSSPAAQKENTQTSSITAASPIIPPSPITQAMIDRARAAGADYKFLAAKLIALQQPGNTVDIDEVDKTVNKVNNDGVGNAINLTALYYAVYLKDPAIIGALCKLGANTAIKDALCSFTPLNYAVDNGDLNLVQVLLQQPGIDVNAKDKFSDTPLLNATRNGNLAIVQELLKRPDILLDERDNTGRTALGLAINNGYTGIENALKAKGAK